MLLMHARWNRTRPNPKERIEERKKGKKRKDHICENSKGKHLITIIAKAKKWGKKQKKPIIKPQ